MGRGRAKAKQTKVARELKYSSGGTDLDRLRAELVTSDSDSVEDTEEEEDDEDDPYAKYAAPADPYDDERARGAS